MTKIVAFVLHCGYMCTLIAGVVRGAIVLLILLNGLLLGNVIF